MFQNYIDRTNGAANRLTPEVERALRVNARPR